MSQLQVSQVIFLLSLQVFQKFSRDRAEVMIFWDQKSQNRLFFNFFITKVSYFVSNLSNNFSEASFEVYYVSVSQKLAILGFSPQIFSFWPRSLPRPPEAKVRASVTSMRSQILAGDVTFHMKHCCFDQYQNWSVQRPLSAIGTLWPPPASLTDQKARIV